MSFLAFCAGLALGALGGLGIGLLVRKQPPQPAHTTRWNEGWTVPTSYTFPVSYEPGITVTWTAVGQ